MLQRLREKAQGWFAWLILGAIAVTFVLFGTANFFTSSGPDESLVKVNGSSISEWEVERAYQRIITSPGNEGLRQAPPMPLKFRLHGLHL